MCAKRQKLVADQRRCRHIFKQVPTPALICPRFSAQLNMRTTISPDLWIVYIPMNRSTCILTIKRVEKVVLRRKKAKVGKTHCFTCFKMRLHLR